MNQEQLTPDIREGFNDGGEFGAGEKLLLLLQVWLPKARGGLACSVTFRCWLVGVSQRWDVQNVVLIISIWEDGLPNTLGGERYKVHPCDVPCFLPLCKSAHCNGGCWLGGENT